MDRTPTKYCRGCGETKSKSAFSRQKNLKDGRKHRCKECVKIYRAAHLGIVKYNREKNLARYGLSVQDYNRMFNKQKGCCAICGQHQSELRQALCIDHNHKTNQVRGLLCGNCNRGLGCFHESRGIFIKAIQYLGKPKP